MSNNVSKDPDFHVVSGTVVKRIIDAHLSEIIQIVRDAYIAHAQGKTINPDSYFYVSTTNPTTESSRCQHAFKTMSRCLE